MLKQQTKRNVKKRQAINTIFTKSIYSLANKDAKALDVDSVVGKKPKPFIKWAGGKRQLLKQFHENNLFPIHKFNPDTSSYFEPFVGGGAIFFDLLPKSAQLSDLNEDLVVTFKVIRDDVVSLIGSLKKHKPSKEYFLEIRSKNASMLSDVERASRFIYLNKTCFNGMYRVNSSGEFNVPFGKYVNPLICDEDNLLNVSRVLQGVEIRYEDYKEVLKWAKKGDFIYFDPPYYPLSKTSSFTSYTAESFLEKEHRELRDTFLALHKKGCFVMLSNSNAQFIHDIYSEIQDDTIKIHTVSATRAINSKGSGRGRIQEIVVTNY